MNDAKELTKLYENKKKGESISYKVCLILFVLSIVYYYFDVYRSEGKYVMMPVFNFIFGQTHEGFLDLCRLILALFVTLPLPLLLTFFVPKFIRKLSSYPYDVLYRQLKLEEEQRAADEKQYRDEEFRRNQEEFFRRMNSGEFDNFKNGGGSDSSKRSTPPPSIGYVPGSFEWSLATLGLESSEFTLEELKKQRNYMVKHFASDNTGKAIDDVMMQKINRAYDVLKEYAK